MSCHVCFSVDGCCRHVAATLFEIHDYQNDQLQSSVTSGSCIWMPRAGPSTDAVEATAMQIGIDTYGNADVDNENCDIGPRPSVHSFIDIARQFTPDACILDTYEPRPRVPFAASPLPVLTPQNVIDIFISSHKNRNANNCDESCLDELESCMAYTPEEISLIEQCTQGQAANENWHAMRNRLITASVFKTVCHSKGEIKTAQNLLNGPTFDQDHPPKHIEFGRRFEAPARNMFFKSHRYKHRGCDVQVPGLCINADYPYLGASPDGILCCKECGKSLVEVKCLSSKRNFRPAIALIMSGIAVRNSEGSLSINPTHAYHYQMQGQMAITGIHVCHLVAYTHKGICVVRVDFDPQFWTRVSCILRDFFRKYYFPQLHVRSYHLAF